MRHVVDAWKRMPITNPGVHDPKFYIDIENPEDVKGVAPVVKFTIQSDPISEVGINGCQAVDIIRFAKALIESLDDKFHSVENDMTLKCLTEAVFWQEQRTKRRVIRGVEGKNEE